MKRLKLDAIDNEYNKKPGSRAVTKMHGGLADAAHAVSTAGETPEVTDIGAFIAKVSNKSCWLLPNASGLICCSMPCPVPYFISTHSRRVLGRLSGLS